MRFQKWNQFISGAFFIGISLFLVMSCGKEKTERQKFEEMKTGLKYKTYALASRKAVSPVVALYNQQREKGIPELTETTVRLFLAYGWAVTRKPTYAIAEAEILKENDKEIKMALLAQSVIAIALYEEGLQNVAHEESEKALAMAKQNPDFEYNKETMILIHLILASLGIQTENHEMARFHFAGFSELTQIEWPYRLFDACLDIKTGNIQAGLAKMKKLSQDEKIPVELRKSISDGIKAVETKAGPVDSKLFVPRSITYILFRELKTKGSATIQQIATLADGFMKKAQ
jgi:hypothetical protein